MNAHHPTRTETAGLIFGFLGVLIFSFSLPFTRLAVQELDPTFVGLGRALLAAALAAPCLLLTRQPMPSRPQVVRLGVVALGVVVGFPIFSAWALRYVPAAHGAVVLGLLPLATAALGAIRSGDRPAPRFWAAALIGSLTVVVFVVTASGEGVAVGDLAMLGAVLLGAIGYVEGGRLAKELGGWQTICWANVLSAPVLIWPVGAVVLHHGLRASPGAWLAFAYLGVFSMFLGFVVWYHGLALGGITRVSQVQLLQAFLSIMWSGVLLGEALTPLMLGAACIVVACIAVVRTAPIQPAAGPRTRERPPAKQRERSDS